MEMPSFDETVDTLSRYAVVMHLEANRKAGSFAKFALFGAVCISVYMGNFWPIVAAVLLSVVAYFFLIFSCVKFVKDKTGMPMDLQAYCSQRYKTDKQFALEVDAQRKEALQIFNYLKHRV